MPSATWAVVAARANLTAKSRLASVLTPQARSALALAMLADVLDACAASALAGVVAVLDSEHAQALALAKGAYVVTDPDAGLSAAFEAGIGEAQRRGASA